MLRAWVCLPSPLNDDTVPKTSFFQALRTRTSPSAVISVDNPALQPWRDPRNLQQNRSRSKTPHELLGGRHGSTSVIYHGGRRPSQLDSEHIPSPQNRSCKLVSHLSLKIQQRQISSAHKHTEMIKRRAQQSLAAPARRRRVQPQNRPDLELKDEAYIRNNLHVPTAKDYPHVDPALFVDPKPTMHKNMQSFANFKSEFSILQPAKFQCTLTFGIQHELKSEVVTGEGRLKVTS